MGISVTKDSTEVMCSKKKNNSTEFGDDQRLTIEEAAQFLNVSTRTVWRAVKKELIPCQRIGKLIRIRKGDLKKDIEPPGYQAKHSDLN